MQHGRIAISTLVLVLCAAGSAHWAEAQTLERSPQGLLKEGLHQERTLRRPKAAAATYRKVIDASDALPSVRAEAHLRLGLCLERTGRTEQARKQFEHVVHKFADHSRLVDRAKRRLAAISAGDPASLLPPDTLLYVELVRPGLQAERFVASLQDVHEEGLERLLDRLGLRRGLRNISATLTEPMREDINRIDSVALGIISKEPMAGSINAKFLLALHPGKSVAARGLLTLMAQSAGKRDGSHASVNLWSIPDGESGVLTFANLLDKPGLGGVMLLGKDRAVVCQAIDRWQSGAKADSLASLPEFRRQAAARRLDSVVLVYADVPRILARLRQDMPPDDRNRYEAGSQLFALGTVERGMARVALRDNGLLIELSLMFNDKPNPFYAMLKTPPADRSLLGFVPTETAAAVVLSVGSGRDKWDKIRTFLDQLSVLGQALGGPGDLDVRSAIREAESMTGLSVAEDLLANCRSLAVLMPTIGPTKSHLTQSPAVNLVLVLRMHRPDEFARRLEESLLDRLRVGMETGRIGSVRTCTYIDTPTASGAALSVARIGDVFLMSLSSKMLERVVRACEAGDVMERSSLGRPAVAIVPPTASKILLLRPELAVNDLRTQQGRSALDFIPVQPVVVYTLEQSRQAALRIEINDLTGLLNNAILTAGSPSPTSVPAMATTTVSGQEPSGSGTD